MKPKQENISINPSKKKGDKSVKIILQKELTIFTIEELKTKIVDVLKKYDEIQIQISNVENIDLSFLQLIDSLKKSAHKKNKKVEMNVELPENLEELMSNAGFEKFFVN